MPIKEYELCIKPDQGKIIWRYMNLEKFENNSKQRDDKNLLE
jgi:hypothetical protein